MKVLFVSLFIFIGSFTFGQNKDLTKKDPLSLKIGLSAGSLKSDLLINNQPINAFVISPKIEIGRVFNFHIGANILTVDSGNLDTVKREIGNLELGLSVEHQIADLPFYLKGGYLIRITENYGNRIFAQLGFKLDEQVDFHLIASRLYARKDIYSGNIVEFGVRLKL
jgi:hypothetical protein